MTDAREIINAACINVNQWRDQTYASAAITALHAAGFRILGPDEVDQVTLEKAAAVAENCPDTPFTESRRWHGNLRKSIPAAIRAIGRKA